MGQAKVDPFAKWATPAAAPQPAADPFAAWTSAKPDRVPGMATIGDQLAAKGQLPPQAMRTPAGFNAAPGGRSTRMDSPFVDEEMRGAASVVPFTGVEAPNTTAGTIGRGGMMAALLAYPASRVGAAATGSAAWTSRALAVVKELGAQAAPALKYEVAKTALEAMGVPPAVAVTVALGVSGYKGRGGRAGAALNPAKPKPVGSVAERMGSQSVADANAGRRMTVGMTEAAASPATVPRGTPAPVAAPPVPPAPVAPPKVAWTVGEADAPAWLMEGAKAGERRVLSPAAIRSAVALVAKRTGAALNGTQSAAADALVKAGATPAAAVREAAALDAQAALLKLPGFVPAAEAKAASAERLAAGPRGAWGPARERHTR